MKARGEKHGNWKGGISLNKKEYNKKYHQKYYQEHKDKWNKKYSLERYYKNHEKTKEHHRKSAEKYRRKLGKPLRKDLIGSKHWNWKGGRTPLYKKIRNSPESKRWREQIFKRDNYTCQKCNLIGENLEAHHCKKIFAVILAEFLKEYNQFSPMEDRETLFRLAIEYKPFWDIGNGITLCKDCHDIERKKDKAIAVKILKS